MKDKIVFKELKLFRDSNFDDFINNLNCLLEEYQFGEKILSVYSSAFKEQYFLYFKIERFDSVSYYLDPEIVTIKTDYPFELKEIIQNENELKFIICRKGTSEKSTWIKVLLNGLVISQTEEMVEESNQFESVIKRLREEDVCNPDLIDIIFDLVYDYNNDSIFNFEIETEDIGINKFNVENKYYPYLQQFIKDKCLSEFGFYFSIWWIEHPCFIQFTHGFEDYIKQMIIVVRTRDSTYIDLSSLNNEMELDYTKRNSMLLGQSITSNVKVYLDYKEFSLDRKFEKQNFKRREINLSKNGIEIINL